jgi:16S rRNA C967 or C1407 C5-methylase (RsmB/RsmF family)
MPARLPAARPCTSPSATPELAEVSAADHDPLRLRGCARNLDRAAQCPAVTADLRKRRHRRCRRRRSIASLVDAPCSAAA